MTKHPTDSGASFFECKLHAPTVT